MRKKGFTLIELLAVIVVLAIIALIATPMVLNTIESARKGAAKSSATTYMKELETEVIKSMMTTSPIKAGKYKVGDIAVDVKGDKPTEGYVCVASDGTVEKASVLVNDYVISYNGKEATTTDKDKVEDIDCGESYVVGDAVTIDGIGYHVIKKSSSTDEYVTLLREESIGNMAFDENCGTDFETSTLKTYLDTTYKSTFGEKEQYIQEVTLIDHGIVGGNYDCNSPTDDACWIEIPERSEGSFLYLFKNYKDVFYAQPTSTVSFQAENVKYNHYELWTKTVASDSSVFIGLNEIHDFEGNELIGYVSLGSVICQNGSDPMELPVYPVIVVSKKALD